MADVDINKFRASVVREGSKPASPGFIVSEGQSPTDPAGSGQNHLPVTITTVATGLSITESQVLGGAGTVGQYIRGDGSLADFPESSGGGSSVSYYLNGSISQGTIGGVAYKELNKVPILGAGTDFTINADGYIASFLTDAGDPNLLEIPGGNWNFETYFSASSGGGSPTFYVELYKVNSGGTATLIASNSAFPELIAFGTNIISYFSTLAVPTTALALTDRLAIRYYVTHSGRTITLHTEDNHLCQIITTFTTGITALNGLTAQIQNFAVGTSGTDFNIASATATHTFNLPTASATNRGALSSADWTTFNNKTSNLGTVTSVGLSSATSGVTIGSTPVTTSGTITLAIATASGSQNGLLSSTDWTTFNGKQNALTNPVTGTGTSGQVAYFTGTSAISSESNLFWDATNDRLGVGLNNPTQRLTISQNVTGINQGIPATSGTTQNGILRLIPNGGFGETLDFGMNVSTTYAWIQATNFASLSTNYNLSLQPNGGNLLVGTSTDNGARLQISGTGNFSGSIQAATESNIVGTSVNARMLVTASGVANTVVGFNNSGSTTTGVTNNTAYLGVLQAYPLVFTTDSVERMRISASGNVGIGVNPSAWSVIQAMQVLNTSWGASPNNLILYQSSNVFFDGAFKYITTGTASQYRINDSGVFSWLQAPSGTAGNAISFTQAMTLTSGGNVLIGKTTDNGARLQVSSSGGYFNVDTNGQIISAQSLDVATAGGRLTGMSSRGALGAIHIEQTTTGANGGYMAFRTSDSGSTTPTEKMRITSSGNVGIGTASPSGAAGLALAMNSGANQCRIALKTSSTGDASGDGLQIGVSGIDAFIEQRENAALSFATNAVERMRITNVGTTLLLGSSSSGWENSSRALLELNNTGSSLLGLKISGNDRAYFYHNNNHLYIEQMLAGGSIYVISVGNGVYLTANGTSWTSNSDERLKNINGEIENAVDKLCQLRAVNFTWKNDENKKENLGLIAQDVIKVFPKLIDKNKLPSKPNEIQKDETEYLGVRYQELIPVLVKAIQELNQKIK